MKSNKIKVAYIIHSLQTGGAEVALISALEHLDSQYDFRLIVLGSVDYNLLDHIPSKVTDKINIYNYSSYLYFWGIVKAVINLLRFSPKVVVSSFWRSKITSTILKLLNRKIVKIDFVHSTIFTHFLDRFFSKKSLSKADVIFADSKQSSQFIHEFKKDKTPVKIISFFTLKTPQDLELRGSHNGRILFLGRMHKIKNIPGILTIIQKLLVNHIDVSLDIVGSEGEDTPNIIEFIKANKLEKNVNILSPILPSDRIKLFSNYSFLVNLSFNEGMAMSVIEGMQYGLVPIVNPVGEMVNYTHHGVNAIQLPIRNLAEYDINFKDLFRAFNHPEYYQELSRNAHNTFDGIVTYDSDLVRAINEVAVSE